MDIVAFQQFVKDHSLDGGVFDVFFTMNALTGELGEMANVVKKEMFYETLPDFTNKIDARLAAGECDTFRDQFIDESGDTFFYFMQALNKKGVTLEEVINMQVEKFAEQTRKNNGKIYKK
jgi:NTP pyrophosphatase (non-canonical NTP hydrolase)